MLAELGLPVALVEDEHRFILAYHILWDTSDVEVAVAIIDAVQAAFPEFNACSFDRGFHSLKNREALDARLALNALPKKGKLSLAERASARLRSRQRGGSTRPSSRVWPISDFGAVAAEESGELRADGEPVGAGGQRAPAGLPGARPGTGTNKASAKARGVGPLPPRRKVPIAGPKGHVCPPDRNTTPFEPQTARARTQETSAWPKHSKRTVNELKKRPCLCTQCRKKRVFGQSLGSMNSWVRIAPKPGARPSNEVDFTASHQAGSIWLKR